MSSVRNYNGVKCIKIDNANIQDESAIVITTTV